MLNTTTQAPLPQLPPGGPPRRWPRQRQQRNRL